LRTKIGILIALVMAISLCLMPAVAQAQVNYDSSLLLENKDGSWQVIPDATQGTLEYNSSGSTFDYRLTVSGLEPGVDYSIIYYADKPNRFVDWGGNNPGALIGTFNYDALLKITSGSAELNMNLPSIDDANISEYDYMDPAVQDPPYATAHGAKIWVVPSDCYTVDSENKVTTWSPTRFLFETDLIWYNDTDLDVVGLNAELEQIVAISVLPTFIHFGDIIPGSPVAGDDIDVENIGTVSCDVDAELDPLTGSVFNYLKLGGSYSPGYSGEWDAQITGLAPTAIQSLTTSLEPPATYSAQGVEYVNLIFYATAAVPGP